MRLLRPALLVAFAAAALVVHDGQRNVAFAAGSTERVSVASNGTQANLGSWMSAISADGRFVAFDSSASNLVAGDTNNAWDVFVHDRQTGATERVSVASNGTQANLGSWMSAISADGRFVAFDSSASNLVAGDTNNAWDVFVHDRQTGATERASVSSDGRQGNGGSRAPAISADGRFVAFQFEGTDLVAGDTNGSPDVFVHDRQTGATERVSVASDGTQANLGSRMSAISADGRYVAFSSHADNLVAGDTNGWSDVFVHDRQTGATDRVSVASDGTQANWTGDQDVVAGPAISADGRFVAFSSDATNLVPGDINSQGDIFVHDRQTGATERVSMPSDGGQANWTSDQPSISADGRYVAFESGADNLVAGDTNGSPDVFVHDRQTGATERVSVASDGGQANWTAERPSISADGRYVAWESTASNLVPGDTNGDADDVFVRDRCPDGSCVPVPPPEQQLANKYAPILYIKNQSAECDPDGDPYDPESVNMVLSNAYVELKYAQFPIDDLVKAGPTAADLYNPVSLPDQAGRDPAEYYLNFPGIPQTPRCTFETTYRAWRDFYQPIAYARVWKPPGTEQIILQYWLFYYFNDWNNTHEGDWEFVMLTFDASSPTQALSMNPASVGYSQHSGGERATSWTDPKIRKEGNHPRVFVAKGSHANYFGPGEYLGLSANGEGLGCDKAVETGARVIRVIPGVVPETISADSAFAWLGFRGVWGQTNAAFYDSPLGPNAKPAWADPNGWYNSTRTSSRPAESCQLAVSTAAYLYETGATEVTDKFKTLSGTVKTKIKAIWPFSGGTGMAVQLLSTPAVTLKLRDPSGALIEPGALPVGVTYYWEDGRAYYEIDNPQTGNWTAILEGTGIPPEGIDVDLIQTNVPSPAPDADFDAVADGTDNCPSLYNPVQSDADVDGLGDACDTGNSDGDVLADSAEYYCGSDASLAASVPERIDGVFAAVDDDGDTQVDEALPPSASAYDCDGDGFKGSAEGGTPLCGNGANDDDKTYLVYPGPLVVDDAVIDDGCPGGPAQVGSFSEAQFNIGGNDQDPCGLGSWPSDFVSGGVPDSTNKINVLDFTSFLAPVAVRRLNTAPGEPAFDKRWDLSPGRGVFNDMINVTDLTSLIAGPSGYPPMLGGVRAFNGPACPWPP